MPSKCPKSPRKSPKSKRSTCKSPKSKKPTKSPRKTTKRKSRRTKRCCCNDTNITPNDFIQQPVSDVPISNTTTHENIQEVDEKVFIFDSDMVVPGPLGDSESFDDFPDEDDEEFLDNITTNENIIKDGETLISSGNLSNVLDIFNGIRDTKTGGVPIGGVITLNNINGCNSNEVKIDGTVTSRCGMKLIDMDDTDIPSDIIVSEMLDLTRDGEPSSTSHFGFIISKDVELDSKVGKLMRNSKLGSPIHIALFNDSGEYTLLSSHQNGDSNNILTRTPGIQNVTVQQMLSHFS